MKGIKRIFALIFTAALLALPLCTLAEDGLQLSMEQYRIEMPQVNVYLYPTSADGQVMTDLTLADTEVSATLDSQELEVRSLGVVGERGTAYLFAVDVANNVDGYLLRNIKASLKEWKNSLLKNDRLLLITYGETVKVALRGDETAQEAEAVIDALGTGQDGGLFQSAVKQAIALTGTKDVELPERKVLIVTSDGKDVDTVEHAAEELLLSLQEANLPLYALGMGSTKASLTALSDLSRKSGGTYQPVAAKDSATKFQSLRSRLDCCYVLELAAANNQIDPANRTLTIHMRSPKGEADLSSPVTLKASAEDHEAPEIAEVKLSEDGLTLKLTFSEPVTGAEKADNYDIREKGDNGSRVSLDKVTYDEAKTEATVHLKKKLYDGDYSIEFTNVCDVSMEKNRLSDTYTFTVDDQGAKPIITGSTTDIPVWVWIAGAGALLAAIAVAAVLITKNQRKERERQAADLEKLNRKVEHVGDHMADQIVELKRGTASGTLNDRVNVDGIHGKLVHIAIAAPNGMRRDVDAAVGDKPYLIGRTPGPGITSPCDMTIGGDSMISSTHCALRVQNGQLLLQDQNSRNGTYLNGGRVFDVRPLHTGDAVVIGKTKLIVLFQ